MPARRALAALLLLAGATGALAQNGPALQADYPLAPGDSVKVQVFQSPELTLDVRVSESGAISYPLIGSIGIGGLSAAQAEKKIAEALRRGGFLQNPQVTLSLLQMRGNQVAVLGQVNRPGRYPIESTNTRLTDMLAQAGGTSPGGDDVVIVSGTRAGQPWRKRIDVPALFLSDAATDNLLLQGGDTVYVHRAPVFYVYGEAQRPGAYRVERGMTVMQALASGGGPTARGSERRLRLHRKAEDGSVRQSEPALTDTVLPDDVLVVKESIF